MALALVYMERLGLHWMRWVKQQMSTMSWERLSLELLRRYGGDDYANPFERLAVVLQDGTVESFSRESSLARHKYLESHTTTIWDIS